MQPARFNLHAKERTGSRLPHSCTTSSGITARSSICSGSTCAERFHGHGGAAMAAMAASWQQQPAQRARAGGGRNAGARPPRARASRPASHLDTAFFARRGLHRRVLLLCGVVREEARGARTSAHDGRRAKTTARRKRHGFPSSPEAATNQSRRHRSRSFPENQAIKRTNCIKMKRRRTAQAAVRTEGAQTASKRNKDALRRRRACRRSGEYLDVGEDFEESFHETLQQSQIVHLDPRIASLASSSSFQEAGIASIEPLKQCFIFPGTRLLRGSLHSRRGTAGRNNSAGSRQRPTAVLRLARVVELHAFCAAVRAPSWESFWESFLGLLWESFRESFWESF